MLKNLNSNFELHNLFWILVFLNLSLGSGFDDHKLTSRDNYKLRTKTHVHGEKDKYIIFSKHTFACIFSLRDSAFMFKNVFIYTEVLQLKSIFAMLL